MQRTHSQLQPTEPSALIQSAAASYSHLPIEGNVQVSDRGSCPEGHAVYEWADAVLVGHAGIDSDDGCWGRV